jgi:hypothetical protein
VIVVFILNHLHEIQIVQLRENKMLNDEKLIEISQGVDSYLSTLLVKYSVTPLSLAAILLARAMVLNKEAGSTEDFLKLLSSISQDPPMQKNEKVH